MQAQSGAGRAPLAGVRAEGETPRTVAGQAALLGLQFLGSLVRD